MCRWHPTEAIMRHVSIVGGPRSQPVVFQQYISISKIIVLQLIVYITKKSIIAKRVRQITLIYTTQYCCCTKKICRITLLAYIFAKRKKSRANISAGGYFRGKIFSREQYIRENILAKIFQIHFSRNFPPAKIKCYLYYKRGESYLCSAKAPVLDGSGSRR